MTVARTLHLMRHGEPALAGRMLGRTNCPATPAGIAACAQAAGRIAAVTTVVASDLRRADACADAIAAPRAIPVRRDPRWRELDFGDWEGLSAAAIDAEALAAFWHDPDAAPPPSGERWSTLVARVAAALADLEDGTLVVTHAGAMRAALAALCGFDARQVWGFDLPYACVLSLRCWEGSPPAAQIVGLSA